MPLNEAQARSVAITLHVLEERCEQMIALITGATGDGVLYQIRSDIPEATRAALLEDIRAIRTGIARLATQFQLSVPPRSARQMLVALLSSSWENVEDTRPAKLGHYGPVDPRIVAPLDAELARLLALIESMWTHMQYTTAIGRTLM